nr:MAG TPA: hypothetical protein [Caudoviricetes sp.]
MAAGKPSGPWRRCPDDHRTCRSRSIYTRAERGWCRLKFIPHDYQRRAIALAVEKPSIGLFLDMGLG